MAEGLLNSASSPQLELLPEEWERLRKRRNDVKDYEPPMWRSNLTDDVSGTHIEKRMVEHASILFNFQGKL